MNVISYKLVSFSEMTVSLKTFKFHDGHLNSRNEKTNSRRVQVVLDTISIGHRYKHNTQTLKILG